MNYCQKYLSAGLLGIAALLVGASPALSDGKKSAQVTLGAASGFAVLAGGAAVGAVTCTNTPQNSITGDVGVVLPGTFTNTGCTFTGTLNSDATNAYAAFLSAYAALAPKLGECTTLNTLTGTLANTTLPPGVYCVSAEAKTGVLTLSGSGTWTFKVLGALTGTNFSVIMAGGGQACNVTWWVDAAATMTDSTFIGTILAGADITLIRGTLAGRAFAGGDGTTTVRAGAVTITGTTVIGCGALSGKGKECDDDDGGRGNGHDGDDDDDDDGKGNGKHDDDDDDGDHKKGTPKFWGKKGSK